MKSQRKKIELINSTLWSRKLLRMEDTFKIYQQIYRFKKIQMKLL